MQRLHFTSRHHGFMLLMSLVVALGTVMLAMPTVAATDARASPTGIVPIDARRCDIDHPQDCIINTPPFTPVVSPIQTVPPQIPIPATGCQPPAPDSAFAHTGFASQWQGGEALAANFWGPMYTKGFTEPYTEGASDAGSGQRLVQ